MATMHPTDIENYKYTYSEYLFYRELKEQLADKYHVFYSVRWFETIEDKRVDSECDFLIFDPGFGFLTIEVKGGRRIEVENGHWYLNELDGDGNESTRKLKVSPFEQAEKSMRHFYKYFSDEFVQTFNGVYGFAVAFPMFQIHEKIESDAPKELIIDIRNMDTLALRVNEIFHYWRNRRNTTAPFSAEQKTRFITMVNKQISLSAAAGALIPIKEKEFEKINLIQDSLIDFLINYNQIQIVGGAGTGKTYIAIKKIIREAKLGKRTLYVCKNFELSLFVKNQVNQSANSECIDFYTLMERMLEIKITKDMPFFDLIEEKSGIPRYDVIIVDEAQDFSVEEALTIRHLLKEENKSTFYIFLDKNQNLFDMEFESAFAIDTKPYVLRYNIRNTGEIYTFATENTGIGTDTIANSLLGVTPEIRECKNRMQAISSVSNIVNRLVQKEYVKQSSIVLLSDLPYEKSIFKDEKKVGAYEIECSEESNEKLKFRTVKEFKGLEADIIIYLKHCYKDIPVDFGKKNCDYVGYTRARYYLYIVKIAI